MQPRISLITLGVADLERSTRFYRDGLGFPVSSASQPSVTFFRTGGAILALFSRQSLAEDTHVSPEGAGFGGIVLAHNAASQAEVDAILADAAAAGATILKPAGDVFWGGYSGHFADPDGHPWEVAYNPFFPFAPDGSLDLPE